MNVEKQMHRGNLGNERPSVCQIQRKRIIASLKQPTLETFYKNWIIYYIYILKQFVLAHNMQIKSTFIIYYYDKVGYLVKSDTSLSWTQESAPKSPTYRVCLCICVVHKLRQSAPNWKNFFLSQSAGLWSLYELLI